MVNQRAGLLASNYPMRAEQRSEAVPEGKVMLSNTVGTELPQEAYLIIKIKEGQVQPGNKEGNCSSSACFSLSPLTQLCVLKWSLTSDVPGLSITLYMNMGDATFELFMLIFKLTMTPLMKDGCWVPLFYVLPNLFWPSFMLGDAKSDQE